VASATAADGGGDAAGGAVGNDAAAGVGGNAEVETPGSGEDDSSSDEVEEEEDGGDGTEEEEEEVEDPLEARRRKMAEFVEKMTKLRSEIEDRHRERAAEEASAVAGADEGVAAARVREEKGVDDGVKDGEADQSRQRKMAMVDFLQKMQQMKTERNKQGKQEPKADGDRDGFKEEGGGDQKQEKQHKMVALLQKMQQMQRDKQAAQGGGVGDTDNAGEEEGPMAKMARMKAALGSLVEEKDTNVQTYEAYMAASRKQEDGDYAGAVDAWNEFVEVNPDDIDALRCRSQAKSKLGDLEGAIVDLSEVLRREPGVAESWFARGSFKSDSGDDEGAIADFDEAIRLDPSRPEVWCCRGTARFVAGDIEGAAADCNEALGVDKDYAGAWGLRGAAKLQMGDNAGAVADCEAALQLDSSLSWARPTLSQARAALGLSTRSDEREVAASGASSHREQGNALFRNGKLGEAIIAYRAAHEAREESWILAISNQAICHLKLGEYVEAVAAADLCLREAGAPHKAYVTKLKALVAQCDFAAAFDVMSELRAQPDLTPEVLAVAEQVLAAAGQQDAKESVCKAKPRFLQE